jgi:hypothetical protein
VGDWNFVDVPAVDRRWRSPPAGADPNSDRGSSAALKAAAPGAVDAYRHLHPTRRAYTFFHVGNGHAARLDRAYVSPALTPYVVKCAPLPSALSDHHPLLLELRPRAVAARPGKGRGRARFDFLACPSHAGHFKRWLQGEADSAPADNQALLQWWPGFKRRV